MNKTCIVLILSGSGLLNSFGAQTSTSPFESSPAEDHYISQFLSLPVNFSSTPPLFTIASAKQETSTLSIEQSNTDEADTSMFNKRERAREAIIPLLRAVFNTRWEDQEVLLTVDAGWRNDSLSIEYKYYNGNNLLALNENLLVEKIYFTVKPEEIDALDTEIDEFQFLYLRNKEKKLNVRQQISRPLAGVTEERWSSSLGIPVRKENLPMIIQLLKDLREID